MLCIYILRILRTTSPQPPLSIFSYIYIYVFIEFVVVGFDFYIFNILLLLYIIIIYNYYYIYYYISLSVLHIYYYNTSYYIYCKCIANPRPPQSLVSSIVQASRPASEGFGACLSLSLLLLRAPRGPLPPRHPPPPRRPRHPPPPTCPQTPHHAQHKRRSRSATGEATIERRATQVKSFDLRPGETPQSPLVRVRQTRVVLAERGAGAKPPRLLGGRSFQRG